MKVVHRTICSKAKKLGVFWGVMHLPGSPGSSPEFVQQACASVFSLSKISLRVSAMFFSFLVSVSLNISSYSNVPLYNVRCGWAVVYYVQLGCVAIATLSTCC